jgi:hypothetical protein
MRLWTRRFIRLTQREALPRQKLLIWGWLLRLFYWQGAGIQSPRLLDFTDARHRERRWHAFCMRTVRSLYCLILCFEVTIIDPGRATCSAIDNCSRSLISDWWAIEIVGQVAKNDITIVFHHIILILRTKLILWTFVKGELLHSFQNFFVLIFSVCFRNIC